MPTTPYLLRLTPSEAFFLGSERTLGEDNAMYFVRSNRFPQQTTLLGIIRFKLLESIGKLGKQGEEEAIELIGSQSFNTKIENPDFGVIKALSPIFLLEGNEVYQVVPKDWGYKLFLDKNLPLLCSMQKDETGKHPAFNPKHGLPDLFVSSKGNLKQPDTIFRSEVRTGITKYSHEEDSRGFYKQEVLRFTNRSWSYGVVVWLAEDAGKQLISHLKNNSWAKFGTENRQAKLNLSPVSDVSTYLQTPIGIMPDSDAIQKVILLNHAYADRNLYDDCLYAVTETVDFRNIETSKYTRDFSALNRAGGINQVKNAAQRSNTKLNLLERGSVFYVSETKLVDFQRKLSQPKQFRTIGYNAYQIGNQLYFYSPDN